MPMHDVGYRKWAGELTSRFARWWMIASTGIAIAFRSQWIKRMMLAAWLPIFGIGIGVFVLEDQLTRREEVLERVTKIADDADIDLEDRELISDLINAYNPVRHKGNQFMTPENRHQQGRMIGDVLKALAAKEIDLNDDENAAIKDLISDPRTLFNTDLNRLQGLAVRIMNAEDEKEIREIVRSFAADSFSEDFAETVENIKKTGNNRLDTLRKLESIPEADRQYFFRNIVFLFDRSDFPAGLPYIDKIVESMTSTSNKSARRLGWSFYLLIFLSYPQGIATLILMALIVPPLISRDLRSRAYFIYFAKPIGIMDYLFGKFTIPATFLFSITTIPALGVFVFAVAMSPELSVLQDTWDLPIRIFLASAVMIVPTVSIALMLSSLTQESRFATFAWFAIWILSTGAFFVMWIFNAANEVKRHADLGIEMQEVPTLDPNWQLISIYHTIKNVQSWIFGVTPMDSSVIGGLILLGILTGLSWIILYWRVSAPIRV